MDKIDDLKFMINSKEDLVKLNEKLNNVEYFEKSVNDPINSSGIANIDCDIDTNIQGKFEGWSINSYI